MLKRIENVLEGKVRPALHRHGGEVRVLELKGNVLYVELLGQCSQCPSAYLTTEQLIQAELVKEIPELERVVLVQSVSQSLLEQAKAILNRSRAHG